MHFGDNLPSQSLDYCKKKPVKQIKVQNKTLNTATRTN